jgi:3alpha(or 20beta)-hydroxysteroid dehydrogenase
MTTVNDRQIVFVTGASGGIGAAITRRFSAAGALVIAADLQTEGVDALAEECGASVVAVGLDVSDDRSWRTAMERTAEFGTPDVLVNNAGIAPKGSIMDQPVDEFAAVLGVNLLGSWLGIKHVAPRMRAAGHGSIINVASVASFNGTYSHPGMSAYISSKWGLRGLTKAAALELGCHGIRVNSIHPGLIDTPLAGGLDLDDPRMWRSHAIKRAGQPDEIAALALFLAGPGSSYCTGSEFIADGGMSAGGAAS